MTAQQTDRELLELASKAAGYTKAEWQDMRGWGEVRYGFSEAMWVPEIEEYWNPLTADGDALRLAVRLRLCIEHNHAADQQRWVAADLAGCEGCYAPVSCVEDDFDDELQRGAATRRAIVRAAAEIGKAMP